MSTKLRKSPQSAETAKSLEKPNLKLETYHSTHDIISNAINTVGTELAKLRIKSLSSKESLSEKELKTLTEMLRTVITLEKHQSELAKAAELTKKLSNMSDDELLEFARSALEDDGQPIETKPNISQNKTQTASSAQTVNSDNKEQS